MGRRLGQAGNTVVPAILAIESLGYVLTLLGGVFVARKDDDELSAEDPVALLGLIRLVEIRSWEWLPTDTEIDQTLRRFHWQ